MATEKYEYMCTCCGARAVRALSMGRPQPGNCPRRPKLKDGKPRAHVWVKNRKM